MLKETLKCPDSNINDQGRNKNSLYIASELGHSNYDRVIISYTDIDINKRNTHYGKTALFIATEKAEISVVQVLTRHHNIKVNEGRLTDGSTAFSIASEKGYSDIMKVLILHPDTDVNLGWSKSSWTYRTKKEINGEIDDATEAPMVSTTIDKGMVNLIYLK